MKPLQTIKLVLFTFLTTTLYACNVDSDNGTTITDTALSPEKATDPVEQTHVKIVTSLGDVTVLLYNETPKHKENFIKLVNERFYEGTLFHRIIKDFMLQGGDPDSKGADANKALGQGGPGYTIEAEFLPQFIHKKGALCAARQSDQVNPEKRSSGSQFYIVTGKVTPTQNLAQMETQKAQQKENAILQKFIQDPKNIAYMNRLQTIQAAAKDPNSQEIAKDSIDNLVAEIKAIAITKETSFHYSEEQKDIYSTIGGTPFLDGEYTVFGEITKGLEIIEKIGLVETAPGDRPKEDVVILSMTIVE